MPKHREADIKITCCSRKPAMKQAAKSEAEMKPKQAMKAVVNHEANEKPVMRNRRNSSEIGIASEIKTRKSESENISRGEVS